jgi:hypothetical protein
MSNSPNNREASKALLAITFAGGMLSPQLPAVSQNIAPTNNSFAQRIVVDQDVSAEVRAYALLRLADAYIDNRDRSALEEEFGRKPGKSRFGFSYRHPRGEDVLVAWSKRISLRANTPAVTTDAKNENGSAMQGPRSENKALADTTLQALLLQLEQSSDKFAQLNMYLIASRLFEKAGDSAGALQCNQILENAFQACERGDQKNARELEGASSVLDSMAYGLVPIDIPDQDPREIPGFVKPDVKTFSEAKIAKAERLKRRSVAIADRLDAQDDTRRKAHRDLALWYAEVGKPQVSEKEKEILFELVGFKSDSLMYGHQIGCGGLAWWVQNLGRSFIDCGRG